MTESLTKILSRFWRFIPLRRRQQAGLLLVLAVITSFAEVVSLGAVLPFIGALTEPEKVRAYPLVDEISRLVGVESDVQFILLLAAGFGGAALIAGVMRLMLLWGTLRLGNTTGADLSIEVFKRTLYQPYTVHTQRSSSEVISGITQKIGTATAVLVSLVTVATSFFVFFAILITLILIDPWVAFVATVSFGSAYLIIARISRKKLIGNSGVMAHEQSQVVKALQEGLGAIRDVLLDGTQTVYVDGYGRAVVRLRKAHAQNVFINQAPRFAMETLGLLMIAGFVIALADREVDLASTLPILAMMAFGAQRLLPLMQNLYGNWSLIAGSKVALIDVLDLLEQGMPTYAGTVPRPDMAFSKSISFENVSFSYEKSAKPVLSGLNFTIEKGSSVGIVGSTGSGKSTALDLVMGLLVPTDGVVKIDGQPITSATDVSAWQRLVAHVPQSIFLSDATVAENIAFGVPKDTIDYDRVRDAAERAQIASFIEDGPEGYSAVVGERGVRLSGGQRQRIGIARALYKNASVLIFDEATSALDDATERAVMRTIDSLSGDLTLFIIAHRVTTLKNCNQIIELRAGTVKQIGRYDEVIDTLNSSPTDPKKEHDSI